MNMKQSLKRMSTHKRARGSKRLGKNLDHKGANLDDYSLLAGRPVKQGFLVKHKCIHGQTEEEIKASLTKNYRKRWFILLNGYLIYYKLPSDTIPKVCFCFLSSSLFFFFSFGYFFVLFCFYFLPLVCPCASF